MPAPSVTYTFANSTTADATQVNTNFTDLINGMSDGTKDFSINALTCAGTATLNGSVALGNSSSDDLTITASLASSVAIKTTNSYDFGSATLSPRSFYLASSDSAAKSVRLLAGVIGTSYTFTLPTSGGTSRYRMETDGNGTTSWQPKRYSIGAAENVGLTATVAASALTVALKGADGNDPSSTNPVDIVFRNATSATGTTVTRSVTSALSMVVSSGSTLGHASAVASYFYVYAIDNAGTVELAVSTTLFDDTTINSTTAEGGAGGADSYIVLYSTTARSNVAIRLLARLHSTQATAGTWATAISEISLMTSKVNLVVPSIQTFTSGSGTYTTPTVRTPKYIRVRMVGGGGGGGGGAGAGSTSGSNGGGTTFGTSLLTANGGTGGTLGGGAAGTGGTASLGTGPIGTALSGAAGASCIGNANGGSGGWGGGSSFGGAGAGGGSSGQAAGAGVANTGGGGGGSGAGSATQTGGAGGGAGGFVDAIIISPLDSYAYAVGAGGAAGTAGANAGAAGAGGSGYIEVTEYYQ